MHLRKLFGDEYEAYARQTAKLAPGIFGNKQPPGQSPLSQARLSVRKSPTSTTAPRIATRILAINPPPV